MRVLISTTANDGHFGPLMSLGRAALASGHQVRVAAPASFADSVRRAGFEHAAFADAPPELVGPVMARLPDLPFDEADATVVREVFGRIDAQAAYPAVRETIAEWRPDVVLREPAELGSLAAAERLGVPHVQLAIGMSELSRALCSLWVEPLSELSRIVGLPDDALGAALVAEPVISPVPESLDRAGDADYDPAAVVFRFGDAGPASPTVEPLPRWGDPELPLVYVTFGSVTGSLPPFAGVFRDALDGLADQPVRVLMTVGRGVDVARLGPVPANARVEAWWPQADILTQAALLLGHGGFGTTMGALTAGVPQVVAPIFTSDQIINARHVAAVGAGRAVASGPDAPGRACHEVAAVLADERYRRTAERVAGEIAALPPVTEALGVLERLAS
jgi:UDP:flavonoid glycosyltransferase YjiC (YdhE family)